jgi:hypothetical protein
LRNNLNHNLQQMIKNQLFTFFFTLILLSIGCKNEQKEVAATIHKEIMAEHDKVMPKMSEINRLKRQLNTYRGIVPDDNAGLKDSLINAHLVLSKTEDMMTDWMEKYKYPDPERSPEDMVKYLTGQKDTISQIGNDVFMSLAIGNALLTQAPDSIKTHKAKIVENATTH